MKNVQMKEREEPGVLFRFTVQTDATKIAKGHQQHKSGAGAHKNKRKETRQQFKQKFRSAEHGD